MTNNYVKSFEKTKIHYVVEIPVDSFQKMVDAESIYSGFLKAHKCLDVKIGELTGILPDIDYNGHFGPCIYFSIGAEDDVPEFHAEITKIINDHLEWIDSFSK